MSNWGSKFTASDKEHMKDIGVRSIADMIYVRHWQKLSASPGYEMCPQCRTIARKMGIENGGVSTP